jgi:Cu+-exporting ATPase
MGELLYAGGKQTGSNIELLVVKEVTQSYLTNLWNKDEMKKEGQEKSVSFVHLLSRYFTYIVLTIAAITAVYWQLNNPAKMWPAVTSIFIIACPCALLLSNTFTNGNILRILSRNRLYLRNAQTIEDIAKATHIVFDKTGTLTSTQEQDIIYEGAPLTREQEEKITAVASHSSHPLSKALVKHLAGGNNWPVIDFKEITGQGIEGYADHEKIKLGSFKFVTGNKDLKNGTSVFVSIDDKYLGHFIFHNHYREAIPELIKTLRKDYKLSVLSGDSSAEKETLQKMLGTKATLLFQQRPDDKLEYIKHLQQKGEKVMMIGDGLNDAGALRQSDIGVAVSEQTNNFTPSSDAIIEANQLSRFTKFIRLCRANKNIVVASFVLSIVYNIIGLFFAVQGNLSPLIAAILMPSSSLSILLITFGSSSLMAKRMKL